MSSIIDDAFPDKQSRWEEEGFGRSSDHFLLKSFTLRRFIERLKGFFSAYYFFFFYKVKNIKIFSPPPSTEINFHFQVNLISFDNLFTFLKFDVLIIFVFLSHCSHQLTNSVSDRQLAKFTTSIFSPGWRCQSLCWQNVLNVMWLL